MGRGVRMIQDDDMLKDEPLRDILKGKTCRQARPPHRTTGVSSTPGGVEQLSRLQTRDRGVSHSDSMDPYILLGMCLVCFVGCGVIGWMLPTGTGLISSIFLAFAGGGLLLAACLCKERQDMRKRPEPKNFSSSVLSEVPVTSEAQTPGDMFDELTTECAKCHGPLEGNGYVTNKREIVCMKCSWWWNTDTVRNVMIDPETYQMTRDTWLAEGEHFGFREKDKSQMIPGDGMLLVAPEKLDRLKKHLDEQNQPENPVRDCGNCEYLKKKLSTQPCKDCRGRPLGNPSGWVRKGIIDKMIECGKILDKAGFPTITTEKP